MQKLVDTFIQAANAFDVEGVAALFTSDAVIDDVSVGDAFVGAEGIRLYLEQFFVGFKTASKLLSYRSALTKRPRGGGSSRRYDVAVPSR
jgi:uncharacterized protein (TIGR02246 family)